VDISAKPLYPVFDLLTPKIAGGFINYLTTSKGKNETLPGLFSLPLQLFA
jgi:hypothetical protein